jgi:hypothetical protein
MVGFFLLIVRDTCVNYTLAMRGHFISLCLTYTLQRVHWQFIGSLTFKSSKLPERVLSCWLSRTVRAGGFGPQQQSGASGVCETGIDENSVAGRLREEGRRRGEGEGGLITPQGKARTRMAAPGKVYRAAMFEPVFKNPDELSGLYSRQPG